MKFSMGKNLRKKATQIAVFACLAVVIGQQVVGAATRDPDGGGGVYNAASSSIDTRVGVYLYGNWLRACFVQANQPLSANMINGYQWFSNSGGTRSLGSVALDSAEGAVKCDDANQVKIAVAVLGLGGTSPYDLLCELGYMNYAYSRNDIKPCKGVAMSSLGVANTDKILVANTSDRPVINNNTIDITSYRLFTPYWGKADQPRLTNDMKYWLYYKTFRLACKPTVTTEPVDAFKQIVDTQVVDANGVTKTVRYQIGVGSNVNVSTYVAGGDSTGAPPLSNVDHKCTDLASYFSQDANRDSYAAWAIANEVLAERDQKGLEEITSSTDSTGGANTTKVCSGGPLGWMLCPILTLAKNISDKLTLMIEAELMVGPLTEDNVYTKSITPIWRLIVGFANLALVIAFLVVIFSQATSFGLSAYGIKKMLPRIIAAAILINLSFFLCAVALDIANVVGNSIRDIIQLGIGAIKVDGLESTNFGQIAAVIVPSLLGGAFAIKAGAIGYIFPLVIIAVMGILTIFVGLAIRKVLIVIMIIISPLAFAAMILPGTEKLFKKWMKSYVGLLVMYPVIMAILYGCALVAKIIIAAGTTS